MHNPNGHSYPGETFKCRPGLSVNENLDHRLLYKSGGALAIKDNGGIPGSTEFNGSRCWHLGLVSGCPGLIQKQKKKAQTNHFCHSLARSLLKSHEGEKSLLPPSPFRCLRGCGEGRQTLLPLSLHTSQHISLGVLHHL